MTISIIGHGYVGLVSAAVFADLGNTVWCVGRDPKKIETLNRGIPTFFEPGLEEMVKRNVGAGRLKFTLDYSQAVPQSEVVFICVGTPPKENGEADLSSVFASAKEVGKNLDGYTVVVCKSTVPIGTNRAVGKILDKEKKKKATFDIASCPEFLREGTALSDTISPDRIVIGSESERAKNLLIELHKPIDGRVVLATIEAAEMIKYTSNSLLATKISFANAIAFLCERAGADATEVLEGVGFDKRIGKAFLAPGVGYGGSCFPKDVKALIATSKQYKYDFKLLEAVDEINDQAAKFFVEKVSKVCGPSVKGKMIGVWGLAFKPNTDDMREAPSIKIIEALKKKGAQIKAYDPQAAENAKKLINLNYVSDPYEAARDAEVLLVITEWNEFRQIDLKKVKKLMKKPVILDGRNIYEPQKVKALGFFYSGVGRN
ncbi:MAG: UDP-glucose/GDP-mannose dehydrogenase family protein [bacterium]|nr:UDP-glucose/GDP-mannose dehydrogenase family protein [bacterium]